MTTFDFVPTNQSAYLPSSYPMPGQFEASLQSSEFLRSIFNNPNTPANGHRNSEPATHLQHLNMSHQQQQPDTLLLPAHHIVSPASSIGSGSGSSGPSSPSSGPYTPTSALLSSSSSSSWHHGHHMDAACDPTSLEAQAQAEMDLQMEMQVQQEFAAFSWGGGPNALWGTGEPAVLMGDDFDINAIPPIELPLTKYTENLALGAGPDGSGLEFGQDFACALDAGSQYHHHYNDGSQGTGGLLFDDMMAGHGF
ncbi:unnamed protein product [Cyclocybe aegerita]|uniref:Uncharacterized protein n=1 Tax=Cyclocybe aegerita TaxID=1973307 RepID=A0A8S0W8E0_CYCAE|nr:unnamed protein product [Cyclocybe aegerita]